MTCQSIWDGIFFEGFGSTNMNVLSYSKPVETRFADGTRIPRADFNG
jgi:hypothetical protein